MLHTMPISPPCHDVISAGFYPTVARVWRPGCWPVQRTAAPPAVWWPALPGVRLLTSYQASSESEQIIKHERLMITDQDPTTGDQCGAEPLTKVYNVVCFAISFLWLERCVWVLESDCDLVHPAWPPLSTVQRTLASLSQSEHSVRRVLTNGSPGPVSDQIDIIRDQCSMTSDNLWTYLLSNRPQITHTHVSKWTYNWRGSINRVCGLIFKIDAE